MNILKFISTFLLYFILIGIAIYFDLPLLFVGLIGGVGLILFIFEFLKLFASKEVIEKVLNGSPGIDGFYTIWCLSSALLLWYLPPLILTVILPNFRKFLTNKIGEHRSAKIDAILSIILIVLTLIKLCDYI